ncbi:MAG: hypothetical protein JSW07_17030 [bacterium]|nr:MAG: hypothetical protein JSW07_17030 [bacterium]
MMSKHHKTWFLLVVLFAIITIIYFVTKVFNYSKIIKTSRLNVVPHPQEIGFQGDHFQDFTVDSTTLIIMDEGSTGTDSVAYNLLASAFNRFGLPTLRCIHSNEFHGIGNAIVVGKLNSHHPLLDSLVTCREMLTTPPTMKPEEYRIDVDLNFVVLLSKDEAATFFGVQTLIQLITKSEKTGECKIAAVRIRDFPDMQFRSTFYGFHLKDLDNDSLIKRCYKDIREFAKYKFNMIALDNHHYGHLEKEIPGESRKKYWERFAEIFEFARKYHLQPRVGGWTRWFSQKPSPWSDDLTTLEGIRTTQKIVMNGTKEYPLKISSGHIAHKVIYDFRAGKSWDKEPVVVADESGQMVYEESVDYIINFGKFDSPFYDTVISGEGEPEGYPQRRGESHDPPTIIRRTKNSRIKDGQTVQVSFSYIGPDPWSVNKFRYCRSDPRIHIDGPNNYIWRWCTQPIDYLNAKIFNLEMDEIRVFGWDKRCLDSGKSRSQIFVDDIKYYYTTIRKYSPDALIFMWSDMADPNHNARNYGTQEVADILIDYRMKDVIMVPWEHEHAKQSIDFLTDKGFEVMASSQEQEGDYSIAPKWAKLLRDKFQDKKKPYGLMHAPWEYDYDTKAGWERVKTAADHAWSIAPYIIHLPIQKASAGEDIRIAAYHEGNKYIFDGHKVRAGSLHLTAAFLYFRKSGDSKFQKIKMKKKRNRYSARIPGTLVTPIGIEYYIKMENKFNTSFSPKSAPETPYQITAH